MKRIKTAHNSNTPENIGFFAVVTFESDAGEPEVWRGEVLDVSEPSEAVRKAVFRALSATNQRKRWGSLVVVLTRTGEPR